MLDEIIVASKDFYSSVLYKDGVSLLSHQGFTYTLAEEIEGFKVVGGKFYFQEPW